MRRGATVIPLGTELRPSAKLPAPTPMENLVYIKGMLNELRPKAADCDAMLAYLIEMAIAHASDLLPGGGSTSTKPL